MDQKQTFCSICGAELQQSSKICPECGYDASRDAELHPTLAPIPSDTLSAGSRRGAAIAQLRKRLADIESKLEAITNGSLKITTEKESGVQNTVPDVQDEHKTYPAGSIVTFGSYPQNADGTDHSPIEWIVLDTDENYILLLSKYGLDVQPYNKEFKETNWEFSSIRRWLNDDFLREAFSTWERSGIATVTLQNAGQSYPNWATKGGNATKDKVFLLSYAQANQYLDVTYSDRNPKSQAAPTAWAKSKGVQHTDKDICPWWLRSPGTKQNSAAYVVHDGSFYSNSVIGKTVCVRPAMWVDTGFLK